jgi:penicillin-binding protein 1A
MLFDQSTIQIPLANLKWARKELNDGKRLGPVIARPSDVVNIGDIIHIRASDDGWLLTQIPKVEGGLIAISSKSDEILAMVGGYDFNLNSFNHVTQAKRQPGSAMKPFIYASALEKGYTLATKINDAPIVKQDQSQDNLVWRPQNHNHQFTGITSLREGLKRSKNLVTIRILESIGVNYALSQINKFGFDTSKFPASLSLALGTPNISIMELAAGYAAFANKGLPAKPYLIAKIYNSKGKLIFNKEAQQEKKPAISHQVAYLISSVLKDIAQSGVAGNLTKKYINRTDVAGKTGTTNSHKDTWYAGFNPEIVAVSWLGYDTPKSIHEYGWRSAFPIWLYFMRDALQGTPEQDMPEPSDLVRVRIDPNSGLLATSEQPDSYFEIFRKDTAPTTYSNNSYSKMQPPTDYLF